jgi:hypothetical protein
MTFLRISVKRVEDHSWFPTFRGLKSAAFFRQELMQRKNLTTAKLFFASTRMPKIFATIPSLKELFA